MKPEIRFYLSAVITLTLISADQLVSNVNKYARVKAEAGLRMRKSPDLKGEKMHTLSNNSVVEILDERSKELVISGKKGKWTKVKSCAMTGWVFGGFVEKDSSIKSGTFKTTGFFEEVSESQYFKIVVKCLQGKEKTFWCFDGCKNISKIKKGNRIKIIWYKYEVGLIGTGKAVVNRIVSIKVLGN